MPTSLPAFHSHSWILPALAITASTGPLGRICKGVTVGVSDVFHHLSMTTCITKRGHFLLGALPASVLLGIVHFGYEPT